VEEIGLENEHVDH